MKNINSRSQGNLCNISGSRSCSVGLGLPGCQATSRAWCASGCAVKSYLGMFSHKSSNTHLCRLFLPGTQWYLANSVSLFWLCSIHCI